MMTSQPQFPANGIARLWSARVVKGKAVEYEDFITREVFDRLVGRGRGYPTAAQYLTRDERGEIEVTIILWFESMQDVRTFAGEDFENAVVDENDLRLLASYDLKVKHFVVKQCR
jgi:hypothetical protein